MSLHRLLRRAWYLLRQRRADADLAEELAFHREMKRRELEAGGAPPAEAGFAARRAVGNALLAREQARDVWIRPWLQDLLREPRFACRSLLKSPGVTATAVILIALVIGGNTTIFSMVHGFLTKPAPGVTASRLVTLDVLHDGRAVGAGDSYPNYADYAAQSSTVRPLVASGFQFLTLRLRQGTYAIHAALVSGKYFSTFGVQLAKGRTFSPGERRTNASELAAVISSRLWQERFDGAGDVLGRTMVLNGHEATVVGVAPPGFQGTRLNEGIDVWLPLPSYARLSRSDRMLHDRAFPRFILMGRLAPGASLREAQAEFRTISARLQRTYPDADDQDIVRPVRYSGTAAGNSLLILAAPRFLAIFSVVTLLTLLIVCANVANLMLGRAVVRQRELAVRRSLGASRVRIVRMLAVEALLMSLTAWGLACLFAVWVSRAAVRFILPPGSGALSGLNVTPDWRVVGYALALAMVGTIAFMLAPALRAWRQDLVPSLKTGEPGVVPGRSTLAVALVVVQLAFSILLLVSAGLAYRSLSVLHERDLGFNRNDVSLATVTTSGSATSVTQNLALLDRLQAQLARIPGVQAACYAWRAPGDYWPPESVTRAGLPHAVVAHQNDVSPGYLAALQLRPLAGRGFIATDRTDRAREVLVTRDLARALWPAQHAVGRTIEVGATHQEVTIAGVVPDARFDGFPGTGHPRFIFFPEASARPKPGLVTFYVRYRGGLDTIGPAIRRTLTTGTAGVPITSMRTMNAQLGFLTDPIAWVTTLLWLFALASLLVAAIGQYAVVAFDARRRRREFGVRLALGASPRQLLTLVVRNGLAATAFGLVLGFALSLAAGTAMRGLLYGVAPTDARTYLGVLIVLGAVSLAACYLPARRAARTDPAAVLRYE